MRSFILSIALFLCFAAPAPAQCQGGSCASGVHSAWSAVYAAHVTRSDRGVVRVFTGNGIVRRALFPWKRGR